MKLTKEDHLGEVEGHGVDGEIVVVSGALLELSPAAGDLLREARLRPELWLQLLSCMGWGPCEPNRSMSFDGDVFFFTTTGSHP